MSQTPLCRADSAPAQPDTREEPHQGSGKLNWLRAGVLGANDGIVSVAGLVVGVAGATTSRGPLFTAGVLTCTGAMTCTAGTCQ